MKRVFLIFFVLINTALAAQINADAKANVVAQAKTMAKHLIDLNYSEFIKFTYPTVVEKMGGYDKMLTLLKDGSKGLLGDGVKISAIEVGQPSDFIVEGSELQCTVPKVTEMETPEGVLVSNGTLIAISKDNGLNWYYVDANMDINAMKSILPNLSNKLVIPPAQLPKFKN